LSRITEAKFNAQIIRKPVPKSTTKIQQKNQFPKPFFSHQITHKPQLEPIHTTLSKINSFGNHNVQTAPKKKQKNKKNKEV